MCARLSQTQRNATHAIVRVVSCRAAPRRSACNAMQCNVCTERCVRLLASPLLSRERVCVASRDAISNTNVCLRRGECTIAHTVSLSPLLSSLAFYLRLRQRLKQCNAVQYITLRCTGQYQCILRMRGAYTHKAMASHCVAVNVSSSGPSELKCSPLSRIEWNYRFFFLIIIKIGFFHN